MSPLLNRISPSEVRLHRRSPFGRSTLEEAAAIVEEVRANGEPALRRHSERLGDLSAGDAIVRSRSELQQAYDRLTPTRQTLLARMASRVDRFAMAQMNSVRDLTIQVPGGRAGHTWQPIRRVGAYAPGGTHPLPSTVMMTVIPARVARVEEVWVASPRPTTVTLAAAWLAGADGLIGVGGAQAVAALAFGVVGPACDLIVGPGNRWVTAAKKHLYGEVGIDFLAGPSEIVVLADSTADPGLVAADLLAQAEHDIDAMPALVCTDSDIADEVDRELDQQLAELPTADVARWALQEGFSVVVEDLASAAVVTEEIAPEHVALHVSDPRDLMMSLTNYGSLFIGDKSAESFADYGAGPNHVLPTGGTTRFQGGLSVLTFLRANTWLEMDQPEELIEDTASLARIEGLAAHAEAAIRRRDRVVEGDPESGGLDHG